MSVLAHLTSSQAPALQRILPSPIASKTSVIFSAWRSISDGSTKAASAEISTATVAHEGELSKWMPAPKNESQ
jgi:hypothetical protein